MGWKNVKQHYKVEHIVHVTAEGICIGSGYILDLIVVGLDGAVKKRPDVRGNLNLIRYLTEMDANPTLLRHLVESPDTFEKSVSVFTYEDDSVIEKQCEEPGWPNVTHDGCVMYENTFSTDKQMVIGWAKRSAVLGIKYAILAVERIEKELIDAKLDLGRLERAKAKLDADYPCALELASA